MRRKREQQRRSAAIKNAKEEGNNAAARGVSHTCSRGAPDRAPNRPLPPELLNGLTGSIPTSPFSSTFPGKFPDRPLSALGGFQLVPDGLMGSVPKSPPSFTSQSCRVPIHASSANGLVSDIRRDRGPINAPFANELVLDRRRRVGESRVGSVVVGFSRGTAYLHAFLRDVFFSVFDWAEKVRRAMLWYELHVWTKTFITEGGFQKLRELFRSHLNLSRSSNFRSSF